MFECYLRIGLVEYLVVALENAEQAWVLPAGPRRKPSGIPRRTDPGIPAAEPAFRAFVAGAVRDSAVFALP